MHAHSTWEANNQILHDDQTTCHCEEFFHGRPRMLTRDLFAVASLLVLTVLSEFSASARLFAFPLHHARRILGNTRNWNCRPEVNGTPTKGSSAADVRTITLTQLPVARHSCKLNTCYCRCFITSAQLLYWYSSLVSYLILLMHRLRGVDFCTEARHYKHIWIVQLLYKRGQIVTGLTQ